MSAGETETGPDRSEPPDDVHFRLEVKSMRSAWVRFAVMTLGLTLAATGCGQKVGSSSSGRTITIESPHNGVTGSSPVHLVVSVSGAQIGPPETGKMHFHIHVDGSNRYQISYSTRATISLPPGQHTLKVVLAEPNHQETSTSASITIKTTGAGGSPTSSPSATSSGYGY